jgi:hypothetical protein
MSVLFVMSTVFYWIGMFARGQSSTMEMIGSRLAWVAVAMALIGTMVRWYESYLIGPDIGHIPVSNLYEVFVLFCWLTTAFYLYFEQPVRDALGGRLRDAGGERRRWLPPSGIPSRGKPPRSSRWCRPSRAGG